MSDKQHWSDGQLKPLYPCSAALEWAKEQPSFAAAWRNCERGDWMLWLLAQREVKRERLVIAACKCARLVLKHATDPRVETCIVTTEKWARGKATIQEVRDAASAANAAAAHAVGAAACAAAAANAAVAANASAAAANAVGAVAHAAAEEAAWVETMKKCANIVREEFPNPPRLKQ